MPQKQTYAGFTPDPEPDLSGFTPDRPTKSLDEMSDLERTVLGLPPKPEPSWFDTIASYIPQPVKSTWNAAWEPLSDLPSRAARTIAEPMMQYGESGSGALNTAALYGGAFGQSVGDVLSGLTSPGNLALTAATGGAGLAGRAGVQSALPVVAPQVARGLTTAGRAIGGATALHGAQQVVDPSTTMLQKGLGVLEAVGGGMATRAPKARVPAAIPDELPIPAKAAPIEAPVAAAPEVAPVKQAPAPIEPAPSSFGADRWDEIQQKIAQGIADEDDLIDLEVIRRVSQSGKITPAPKPPAPTKPAQLAEFEADVAGMQGPPRPDLSKMRPEELAEMNQFMETGSPAMTPEEAAAGLAQPPTTDVRAFLDSVSGEAVPPTRKATIEFEGGRKVELEFLDPATGEVRPASMSKPGDIPLPVRPPEVAAMPPRRAGGKMGSPELGLPAATPEVRGKVGGEIPPATAADTGVPPTQTPKEYMQGKPQVDTGPVIPENAPDVAVNLADRLRRAVDNAGTPNPQAADEIRALMDEASDVVNKMPNGPEKQGAIRSILGANKALLTSWDLSAPGRQGKAFIFNKSWWTSLDDMVKAWGSKAAADNITQSILEHPSGYFTKPVSEAGKVGKSFAEKAGLDLSATEEMFTNIIERTAGKIPLVARSSRAHTAFLNKLRSDQFVSMMESAKAAGMNPETNMKLAQSYAKFINDATGRGSVNIGNWKLERNLGVLNDVFFAPKNMAGQIRTWNGVLNPVRYYNYDPVLRKQALRSLFAVAGAGLAVGEMARMAGAKVSNDPTSADFRKIKVGDTRIDMFGGYQQFPVAAMKLISGQSTPTTGKNAGVPQDLTSGRIGQNRETVAERFFTNRLSPAGSFIYSWLSGREFDGKPFEAKRALYERVFPIAAKDLLELAQEDPALAAMLGPTTLMGLTGTQTYSGR